MLDYHYVTFLAVCQTQSYTEAAKLLNLTQPAVSKHIAQLQEMVGVELLVYKHKKLTLTEAGEHLYQLAAHIQKEGTNGLKQLSMKDLPLEMNIACTLTIGNFLIGDALGQLLKKFPQSQLTLIVENTYKLVRLLIHDEIDCAFVEGDFDRNFFKHKEFHQESLVGVCSPENSLSHKEVSVEEISDYTLINREEGSGQGKIVSEELMKKGVLLGQMKQISVASFLVIKDFVKKDLGIAFLYESAVKKEIAQGELAKINLATTFPKEKMYFIYRHENATVKRILDNFSLFEQE